MFRYPNPDHAVTSGYKREVWREHNPVPNVASDFFQNTGFTTITLPNDMHEIGQHDLKLTFKNNDGTDSSFNSLPSFLIDKTDVYQGSRMIETVDEMDMWFDQVVYRSKEEHERFSDTTRLSSSRLTHVYCALELKCKKLVKVPKARFIVCLVQV